MLVALGAARAWTRAGASAAGTGAETSRTSPAGTGAGTSRTSPASPMNP